MLLLFIACNVPVVGDQWVQDENLEGFAELPDVPPLDHAVRGGGEKLCQVLKS